MQDLDIIGRIVNCVFEFMGLRVHRFRQRHHELHNQTLVLFDHRAVARVTQRNRLAVILRFDEVVVVAQRYHVFPDERLKGLLRHLAGPDDVFQNEGRIEFIEAPFQGQGFDLAFGVQNDAAAQVDPGMGMSIGRLHSQNGCGQAE